MLMNFSEPCLLSKVNCNTASNEGNEITNLINGSDEGFIAYYAVRPPVHIDFKFVCKVQLSHIVIWPSVGAQKSSGLKLSVRPSYHKHSSEYKDVVSVFLKPEDQSVFLYRNDFDYTQISEPANAVKRYIQLSKFSNINAVEEFRITILKTDNSVPALRRVEIWGRVSPVCDATTKLTLESLWKKRYDKIGNVDHPSKSVENKERDKNDDDEEMEPGKDLLDVPEEFLDPITCEIMTRPIVLPSGKIIDHSTLEKHERSETDRGRKFSDPFTGLAFNEQRVAIPALALKERIDKFLLAHSNNEEIKKMPRVLGTRQKRPAFSSEIVMKNKGKITVPSEDGLKKRKVLADERSQKTHRLPFCALKKESSLIPKSVDKKVKKKNNTCDDLLVISKTKKDAEHTVIDCDCCSDRISYKLPCKHVICRKALLEGGERCKICDIIYKSSDPVRIYV